MYKRTNWGASGFPTMYSKIDDGIIATEAIAVEAQTGVVELQEALGITTPITKKIFITPSAFDLTPGTGNTAGEMNFSTLGVLSGALISTTGKVQLNFTFNLPLDYVSGTDINIGLKFNTTGSTSTATETTGITGGLAYYKYYEDATSGIGWYDSSIMPVGSTINDLGIDGLNSMFNLTITPTQYFKAGNTVFTFSLFRYSGTHTGDILLNGVELEYQSSLM